MIIPDWKWAKEKTEMEGWHIYDHRDKAVPYDVLIKSVTGQKRCHGNKIYDLSGTRRWLTWKIYDL